MIKKLFFASSITLFTLFSFVAGITLAIMVYLDSIDVLGAILFSIIINVAFWLIGPWLSDFVNKWFYKVKFFTKEEIQLQYPQVFEIVNSVSTEYNFKFPKIGIISDQNPTAFTYGSGRYNARIVLTEGIFHFLNPGEVRAVLAHELGHIVNRDFAVLMIASTFVQILYQIYAGLSKSKDNGKKGGGAAIAIVAYVLYQISIYILYYLSRTREYLADAFSAQKTDPKDLATALIKIAYGIVATEDTDSTKNLLQSTRHLGILDVKNAKQTGVVSYITNSDPSILSDVMVFDKVSPWAKLIELSSTHPLTGKRIDALSDFSKKMGTSFYFDIDYSEARMNIDKSKLYGMFFKDILIIVLPFLLAFLTLIIGLPFLSPILFMIGVFVYFSYKYNSKFVETTVVDQMRNVYASPMRGAPVVISGQVIGRGIPGYVFGSDMMYQDNTGLVFLKYMSLGGFIGNFFFSLKKIKTLFGKPSVVSGWFFRGMGSMMVIKNLKTEVETIKCHPIFWEVTTWVFVLLLIVILFVQ